MRLKKRAGFAAVTALVFAGGTVPAAFADEGDDLAPTPTQVTTIAQVTPLGLVVTGVALQYSDDLGEAQIDLDVFEVTTKLPAAGDSDDPVGPRTVVDAYTSSVLELNGQPSAGNYIILALDGEDERAGGTLFDGQFTQMLPLDDAITVTQLADLELPGGDLKATEDSVFESNNSLRITVDQYEADVLAASNGIDLPYRLFRPNAQGQVPLVVTLHGHGESGTNNLAQVVGNQISVAFADPERQANNPAYVLSPQTQQGAPGGADGVGWWIPEWQDAVIELVEQTIAENPNIDTDRVYLTGLSMGSFGSWAILPQHTDLFAAAVLVCGAGDEEIAVDALSDFPIWALHSIDDFVVQYDAPGSDFRIMQGIEESGAPVAWSEWSASAPQDEQNAAAQAAVDEANDLGATHIFTTFPEGTTPVMSHFSWVPTYSNPVVLDWLFAQERVEDEVVPEPAPDPEPQPEPDPDPETEPQPEPQPQPQPDSDPQPEPVLDPEAQNDSGLTELPRTGAQTLVLPVLSLALVLGGVALMRLRRMYS